MNLKVIWTSRFKKDYKLAIKRNLNIAFIPKQFIITSVRFDMVNHRSLNVFPVPLTNLAQRMFSKICLA